MVEVYNHVKHCTTHPKFLHSNSTSHRWVFGAIAELIDNAIDPDVCASQFCIDMKEFNGQPCLVFMDNGCGLFPEKLHKMLSFGHSKKQIAVGDRSIGKHGNGFKSGTMRLGKDVLVLTKCADSMTAGFLSQTFLADTGAEDILIPQLSWDLDGNRLSSYDLEIEESLRAICKYSIFPDEESLLAQLEAIPVTGAILIISNLRKHEGVLELDFDTDPHDIRITSGINSSQFQQLRPNQPNTTEVPMDYSLRAYVSILYKVPRMQIFIRDKKVKTKRIGGILSLKETEYYKPAGATEQIKIELGFNTENKNLYGMMLYHRNRLIKAYMRVGIQLEENERGMGVIGLAEADFLQPTHNKQDFDDSTAYRRLLKKLSDVLAEYWWEKKERVQAPLPQLGSQASRRGVTASTPEDVPDVIWVQCDNPACLKWRILPRGTDVSFLPDIWYCEYHPDLKFRSHGEPEQEWDPSAKHEIIERRKERKRQYDREKKEREAERKRQRLKAAKKDNQEMLERQRKALEKEVQAQAARGEVAQKEYAALLAEKSEILRKHNETMRELEKAQAELSRKERERENAARLLTRQVQSEEPREVIRITKGPANGHVAEEDEEEPVSQGVSNTEETVMPRVRASRGTTHSSASTDAYQPSIESIGDLHRREASRSPSMNALGNSPRSAATLKSPQRQRELKASQPHAAEKPLVALSRESIARGGSGDPQQSQRKGISSSSAKGRAGGFHGASAENRKRMVKGGTSSQRTGAQLPSAQELDHRHSLPSGEVLPSAVTPTPPTPSPIYPPSLHTTFTPVSTQTPNSALLDAANPMCELNQQPSTAVVLDYRSSSAAVPAQRDLLSPPLSSANGKSVQLRRGNIFTEQGVEESPASYHAMDVGNGKHISPDVRAPSSDSRSAPPQTENYVNFGSGMLSVHLPMDSMVLSSNSSFETELTRAFFKSQRQFRLMINTLTKIGGSEDPNVIELDGLPQEDSEVVAICEKATQQIENMMQSSRQEVAKLKAELAYLMADKMQNGLGGQSLQGRNFKIQSIAHKWGIGVDLSKQG
ncbi:unnamed protein product [Calypogeia fissa]